mmetsp:Transcript_12563/g.18977  ORF Transcript_12563/g.18977 Transcript_12563/m.18977 type:complete len:167 (-) Transcript_12563:63-563(-)
MFISAAKKRKNLEVDCSLSDQIKRVKISTTPGDLRLQKDLKDFDHCDKLEFRCAGEIASVILTFKSIPACCPNTFLIRVPRHYPHHCPQVRCLSRGFHNQFIDCNGNVIHPDLTDNWNAMNSLMDIVRTLEYISAQFSVEIPPQLISNNRCINEPMEVSSNRDRSF